MKKRIIYALFFLIVLAVSAGVFTKNKNAEAASNYKEVIVTEKAKKVGKYYFKSDSRDVVYISKKKSSGYKKTVISSHFFINGTTIFYINPNQKALTKYTLKTGKATLLKKLPKKKETNYLISVVQGSRIYITKISFDQWKQWTYMYQTKKKTWKLIKSDCAIIDYSKSYAVAEKYCHSDVSPNELTIYKLTSTGLKKVRKLATRGFPAKFTGGRLYYGSYKSSNSINSVTLYQCKTNGASKKKIKTFKSSGTYSECIISKITSTYCYVMMNEKSYKYTYKTKKLSLITP